MQLFRAWCVECPDRELILANVQYEHVLEMLECIHPTYKAVDDQSVHVLLPLAFDYQVKVWYLKICSIAKIDQLSRFSSVHEMPFSMDNI